MAKSGTGDFFAAATTLPASLQPIATNWAAELGLRQDASPEHFPGSGTGLLRLVACSEFAAAALIRDWQDHVEYGGFGKPLDMSAAGFGDLPAADLERSVFMRELRRYRRRGLVRILWADVVEHAAVPDCLAALSDLADRCIDAARLHAEATMRARYGEIVTPEGKAAMIILSMGKLGGRELNFSSDIDLVFLHSGDGESSGPKQVSAHEYFGRVAREVVALLDEVTADGFVYRVDTRLRPFGNSGPPVISVDALEAYLVDHGREWERYAYVKARPVGSQLSEAVERLMTEVLTPFVYRRYLDYGVFESLREMHGLITAEVRRREMLQNIKLGPGGIREVEFIVQSLQLVRGGSVDALRTPALRAAVYAAVDDRDWSRSDADRLIHAYDVLRRVENLLQAIRDRQTHDLPGPGIDRDRLCVALEVPDWSVLDDEIASVRQTVADQFREIGVRGTEPGAGHELRADIAAIWQDCGDADVWYAQLTSMDMPDAREVAQALAEFRAIPALRRIDAVAATRLRKFVARLVERLAKTPAPAHALARVLDLVHAVLRRSAYLALLNENPAVLDRLLDLCSRSSYLAREMAAYPVLLDELIDARIFEQAPTAADLREDLAESLHGADPADIERRLEVLTDFKRAALFRIAVADFSGSIPVMKVSDRLTDVAEMVLVEALAAACADMEAQFGNPLYTLDGETREAGLGVIAYGKLAGLELSYSSDLDLVFIHDSCGENQQTDGRRPIENAVYFSRLVRRLLHLLTVQTGAGALYEIDTRLRPSGHSGLLVTSVNAFEKYQEENAWTWEHQALLRSRPVAGSESVADSFERIRDETLRNRVRRETLAEDVSTMRGKMRAQLDTTSAEGFDLKNGRGGIGDIEFLVQYQALAIAGDNPSVIRFPDNIRQLDALAESGCWPGGAARRLQDIYRTYRQQAHHLALDGRDPVIPAAELEGEREYVISCWTRVFAAPPP